MVSFRFGREMARGIFFGHERKKSEPFPAIVRQKNKGYCFEGEFPVIGMNTKKNELRAES